MVEAILRVAAQAPSSTNIQPWEVHVLTGRAKERLSARLLAIHDDPLELERHQPEYDYYPTEWAAPYLARRRKVGWDLYGLLGIEKTDKAGMHSQHGRNYRFFDAPVGLIFSIDRRMGQGSWLDYGMFLQNVMLAARGKGLDTCPQAAISNAHHVVRAELQIPDTEQIVCGMSLGYADPDAPENKLVTVREPVAGFAQFLGFE
jgi:nitroreductase